MLQFQNSSIWEWHRIVG